MRNDQGPLHGNWVQYLMLVMWFTLEVLYCIHAKDFLDSTANLCLCIVTEEGIGGTMKSDEIF
jgi:hypothetical protein